MSQSIPKTASVARTKNFARRHLRLAKRTGNDQAITISNRIVEPLNSLVEKDRVFKLAREASEDCYDDWEVTDTALDSTVKKTDRRAVDWDAEHPGADTKKLVFNGKATSEVTNMAKSEEPNFVNQMVERGRTLPAGHPVIELLPLLAEEATNARNAEAAWKNAVQAELVVETALELEKLHVIRMYYDNQIDIERACGIELAERCFPTVRSSKKKKKDDETDD